VLVDQIRWVHHERRIVSKRPNRRGVGFYQRVDIRCQTGWTTTRTLYAASFERHLLCDERGDSMANVAARLSKVEERVSLLSTMASEWGMGADSRPRASKGA